MKKLTRRVVALAAVATLSLAGCSVTTGDPTTADDDQGTEEDGAEAPDASEGGDYRVAYIARAQADSFAAWLANEMLLAAESYDDITVEVFDGQADDEVENTLIENAITNQFDAVIVQANNADAQFPYIQQVVDAGIVTITTNPRVEGLTGANSVDANPYDQGAVVAQLGLEQIPEDANVVVLNGPAGNFHSTARRDAWEQEFFEQRPDVTIVAEDIGNWNKDEALRLMEDWSLAHTQIDAIISMNDNMAAGALEAVLGNSNFEDILVYGVDGTPEAVLLIADGLMAASTLQNARELAELNLATVHDLLTGAEDEVNVDIGNPVITIDNAQEYIDLYKETGLIDE